MDKPLTVLTASEFYNLTAWWRVEGPVTFPGSSLFRDFLGWIERQPAERMLAEQGWAESFRLFQEECRDL